MISKFTRKDFLEALFGDYYKQHRGFILVKSFKRGDPKMSTRYFPNIEILAKEYYGEERDVYFGVAPRERMKPEKEHIHYLVALWANLDIGKQGHEENENFFESPQHAAKAIRSFPKTPSIIVESGRGAHLYWLLKQVEEITEPEKIEQLLQNISTYLKSDYTTGVDTTLRLPETVNTKIPDQMVNCEVKFVNTSFRYKLGDFERLGEGVRVLPGPPASPAATPQPPTTSQLEAMGSPQGDDQIEVAHVVPEASSTESLVLDESIIDDLIDDISMTGTIVTEAPETQEVDASPSPPRPAPQPPPSALPEQEVLVADEDSPFVEAEIQSAPPSQPPTQTQASKPPPRAAPAAAPAPPPFMKSAFLEKLSSARANVEISLVGSDEQITGTLLWNDNGLIGVQSGNDHYTIPISSVSFIKNKVPI